MFFTSALRSWFLPSLCTRAECARRYRRARRATSKPTLEWLENRRLLSVFVVNSTDDTDYCLSLPNDPHMTLREAIPDTNTTPGADTIKFNIPGPANDANPLTSNDKWWTIQLVSDLPPITDAG